MKSPIKDRTKNVDVAIATLKELIPKGSIINSYLFYGGDVEFNLCRSQRFLNVHAHSYPVYQFWNSLFEEGEQICNIVQSDLFRFEPEMFPILQEKWHTYEEPTIRAALFFILNRCSSSGLISSGALSTDHYSPLALSYLKRFRRPSNFHLNHIQEPEWWNTLESNCLADFILLPCGDFSHNLFEAGKNRGVEEAPVHHRNLRDVLRAEKKKWIVCYNYHSSLSTFFDQENIIMIDKYGRSITDADGCEVMVIYNFD